MAYPGGVRRQSGIAGGRATRGFRVLASARALLAVSIVLAIGAMGMAIAAEPSNAPPDRLAQLIEQLGAADFATREQAEKEIERMGLEAYDALEAATTHPDLEVATRARRLLRALRWMGLSGDSSRDPQVFLRDYESQQEPARRERVLMLATLPQRDSVEVLCRIIRFDKSLPIARLAAAEIVRQYPPGEPPDAETVDVIEKTLRGVRREPAEWLRAWAAFRGDASAALTAWKRLVDALREAPRRGGATTAPDALQGLLLVQLDWQNKLGLRADAAATAKSLVEIGPGDPNRMQLLAREFLRRKAWAALAGLDESGRRISGQFPAVLYLAARGHAESGNKEAAEALLRQLREANAGASDGPLNFHVAAAVALAECGQVDWAEFEYRHVIDTYAKQAAKTPRPAPEAKSKPDATPRPAKIFGKSPRTMSDQSQGLAAYRAKRMLAELLSGQHRYAEAAELARQASADETKYSGMLGMPVQPNRNTMLSYACLYEAMLAQAQKDPVKQRKALEDSAKADPTNPDTLIACYRLPGGDAAFRSENQKRIRDAVAEMRQQLGFDPAGGAPVVGRGALPAVTCNNLAWLLANTGGDGDEALTLARTAVRTSPQAGYYDTLAHVHYARREWDAALKYQSLAVAMGGSLQMRSQLEVFRKAAEAARGKPPAAPAPPTAKTPAARPTSEKPKPETF